jgi:hypothetical protein
MRTAMRNVSPACRSSVATTTTGAVLPCQQLIEGQEGPSGSSCPALVGASTRPAGARPLYPRWRRAGTVATAEGEGACGLPGRGAPVRSRRRAAPRPTPAACCAQGQRGGVDVGLRAGSHATTGPSEGLVSSSPGLGSGPSVLLKDRNATADRAALQGVQRTTSGPSSGPPRRTSRCGRPTGWRLGGRGGVAGGRRAPVRPGGAALGTA